MKRVLSAITILAFGSIALMSVSAISHVYGDGQHNCLAATFGNNLCPNENALNFINFHFKAFQFFSSATFGADLLLLVMLLAAAAMLLATISNLATINFAATNRQDIRHHAPLHSQQITHWLSLHENSPSLR